MTTLIVIGAIVLIGLYALTTYNKLVAGRNEVKRAFADMDVYLKQRCDQIPNLVAIVKGYAKHEAETLEKVVAMRSRATTPEEQIAAEKQISTAVHNLMVNVERYPDLKANTNFLDLQNKLSEMEDGINKSRRVYNGTVLEYNNLVEMAPSNIIANFFHFQTSPMFEVDSAEERKNVKIEF